MQPTYRVIETGEIGVIVPCPCDDPIILKFKDGVRDVFFLRELEPTTHPITDSYPTRRNLSKNGQKGRPKGLEQRTIEKMLQIYEFLKTQSQPVYRASDRERGRLQLHTPFDVSAVATETSHDGELGDCGTSTGGTDVGGLEAHGTG